MKFKEKLQWALLFMAIVMTAGCASHQRRYVDAHPELSEQSRSDILAGGVRVGMTEEQAWAAFSGQHVWSRNNLNGVKVVAFGSPSYGLTWVSILGGEVVSVSQTNF